MTIAPPSNDTAGPSAIMENALSGEARAMLEKLKPASNSGLVVDAPEASPAEAEAATTASGANPADVTISALDELNPFSSENIRLGRVATLNITPEDSAGSQNEDSGYFSASRDEARAAQKAKPVTIKKKMVQPKFSRRRYLREYEGTALLTVVLVMFLFCLVLAGSIMINFGYLIPQTQVNNNQVRQAALLERKIEQLTPRLRELLNQQGTLKASMTASEEKVPSQLIAESALLDFITLLERDKAIRLTNQRTESRTEEEQGHTYIALELELETTFLRWLSYRETLMESLGGVDFHKELITAPAGRSNVKIFTEIRVPVR